jgi:hypothetical protein
MQAITPNTNPKGSAHKIWYQQTWHTIEFSNNGHTHPRDLTKESHSQ